VSESRWANRLGGNPKGGEKKKTRESDKIHGKNGGAKGLVNKSGQTGGNQFTCANNSKKGDLSVSGEEGPSITEGNGLWEKAKFSNTGPGGNRA